MKQVLTTPRLLLAAPGSGNGKTTLSCGLLWALKRRFEKVKSFKCGPDYIDPMFHAKMLGSDCRNLDLFLSGEEGVRFLLGRWARDCGFALMEGVMGLYDGLGADSQTASTNHLALATGTPTVLVVRPKGMSLSLKALLSGFLNFSENRIRGVIFNQCSKGMYPVYSKMAKELGLVPCGFLPPLPEAELGSRHLGLITAQEVEDLEKKLELLGRAAEENLDLDALCQLAEQAQPMEYRPVGKRAGPAARYAWPLPRTRPSALPTGTIWTCWNSWAPGSCSSPPLHSRNPREAGLPVAAGGYPEEWAQASAVTDPMLNPSGKRWPRGCPPSPNAAGFSACSPPSPTGRAAGFPWRAAGRRRARMTGRLVRFGYQTLTAKEDNLLCRKGESLRAHEFHYSDSDCNGMDFQGEKEDGCGTASTPLPPFTPGIPTCIWGLFPRRRDVFWTPPGSFTGKINNPRFFPHCFLILIRSVHP